MALPKPPGLSALGELGRAGDLDLGFCNHSNDAGTRPQGWRSVFVIGGAKTFFWKFLSLHWGGEMILYPSKTYSRPGGRGAVTEFRSPKSTFSLSSSVSFKL